MNHKQASSAGTGGPMSNIINILIKWGGGYNTWPEKYLSFPKIQLHIHFSYYHKNSISTHYLCVMYAYVHVCRGRRTFIFLYDSFLRVVLRGENDKVLSLDLELTDLERLAGQQICLSRVKSHVYHMPQVGIRIVNSVLNAYTARILPTESSP